MPAEHQLLNNFFGEKIDVGGFVSRVNINDRDLGSFEFNKFCSQIGCFYSALGGFVVALRLAQEFYKQDKKPIPLKRFRTLKFHKELLSSGLFVRTRVGVTFNDHERAFKWIYDLNCKSMKSREIRKTLGSAQGVLPSPSPSPVLNTHTKNVGVAGVDSRGEKLRDDDKKNNTGKESRNKAPGQNENAIKTNAEAPPLNENKKTVVDGQNSAASPICNPGANFEHSILGLWNAKMSNKVRGFFVKRRDLLEQARNEEPSLEYWSDVIDKVAASEFLAKGKGKQKLWRTTLDWVLENHIPIMEGKYDDQKKTIRTKIRTI